MTKPAVLITGASAGIGAVYADRFARRGHDLVLVARNKARLDELAARLVEETGVAVDVLQADLSNAADVRIVEDRLRADERIGILINNAGLSLGGAFSDQPIDALDQMIAVHVVTLTRLAHAIAARLTPQNGGAIVNIGSVVGLSPEYGMPVYGATKAYVLHFSQALGLQLANKGGYVQAVLPAATRTELWGKAGVDVDALPGVMQVEDLVDAALVGFDQREAVTIPPLHNLGDWDAFEAARQAMAPGFSQSLPAERYISTSHSSSDDQEFERFMYEQR